jgi:hypothetical protein
METSVCVFQDVEHTRQIGCHVEVMGEREEGV